MRLPFLRRPEPDPQLDELVILEDGTVDPRLVVLHEPHCYQAEQYRAFRTNLRAMNPGDAPRTLMFTSSDPDEGKSTTVANVALSLAEFDEVRVCLLDLDLRAPRIHELFGLPRGPGLSDVLLDRQHPRRALQQGGVPNLSVLTAGRPTDKPNEVLGSEYVQELIAFLKRDYNYIIVDTPPCSLFADASQLSTVMDGVILVVALHATLRHQADEALASLDAAGANVVGTFVTGAHTASNDEISSAYRGD